MRAPRFIRRTELGGLDFVPVGNDAVLDRHDELQRLIAEKLGPAAGEIFAEPVVTRGNGPNPGSVSWYARAGGEPRCLTALQPADRAKAEALLRRALAALEPGLGDARLGPLLRAALGVPSLDDVLLLDDAVVLTGWGLAPQAVVRSPAALADHARATLGAYAPFLAASGATPRPGAATGAASAAASAAAGAAVGAGAARTGASGGGGPPTPPRPVPIGGGRGGSVWTWWLLPFAVVFALAFLGAGFWLGWTLLAERIGTQTVTTSIIDERETRDLIEAQKKTNEALERQVAEARGALAKNVCTADAPTGLTPPAATTPVKPENLPQPPAGQQFTGSLAQLLEQAIVLVIGAGPDGVGMGTGFFVSPKQIVTNRHVVEKLAPEKIFVTNKPLAKIRQARLLAKTGDTDRGGPDYAVLEIDDPPPIQPLGLTRVANRMDDIYAAGFPSFVLAGDSQFRALLGGDASAIPELVVTNGLISAVQLLREGVPIMPITASISPGNSGGPVVDRCGRVVGVNTFLRINQEQADKINYAQKTDTLLEFLKSSNVDVAELQGPCAPPAGAMPAVMTPGAAGGARGGQAPPSAGSRPGAAPSPAQPQAPAPAEGGEDKK